ncbi:hypothetical protein AMK27_39215 [Streptomyces sp. CB02009]|nr:hypothetical protein AMK27_39215 [Streptomyces sp. CB02009]
MGSSVGQPVEHPLADFGVMRVCGSLSPESRKSSSSDSSGGSWPMPHNPAYEPILGDDAVILGKVVAVLRTL